MKELDAWLETHHSESKISPAKWSDLPEDLVVRLENLARDEAVRRADEFASEGNLDLSRHDAVRQLVNAMAQAWTLPGDLVCRVVEDYIDELPPDPGHEFEKLADKLFRRRASTTWDELKTILKDEDLHEVVQNTVSDIALPPQSSIDKQGFLNVFQDAYDSRTINHPKDCVNEIAKLLGITEKKKEISLSEVRELVEIRGATTWVSALDLELEVGIIKASKEELIRILKRFALLQKKQGGPTGVAPSAKKSKPAILMAEEESEVEEVDEAVNETEEVDIPEVSEELEGLDKEISEIDEDLELDDIVDLDDLELEIDEDIDEADLDEGSISRENADSDEDAIEALFGSEDAAALVEDDDEIEELEDESQLEQVAEFDVQEEVEDTGAKIDLDAAIDEADEESSGEDENGSVVSPEEIIDFDESVSEEVSAASESDLDFLEKASADEEVEDSVVEEPEEEEIAEVIEEPEEKTDKPKRSSADIDPRFKDLMEGELRNRIVNEMYSGHEEYLDIFLTKISGTTDWNRAKQFIANELFRNRIDLNSELGEEFYVILKNCMGQ